MIRQQLSEVAINQFHTEERKTGLRKRDDTIAAIRHVLGDQWVEHVSWKINDEGIAEIDGVLLRGIRTIERRPGGDTSVSLEAAGPTATAKWTIISSMAELGRYLYGLQAREDRSRFRSATAGE